MSNIIKHRNSSCLAFSVIYTHAYKKVTVLVCDGAPGKNSVLVPEPADVSQTAEIASIHTHISIHLQTADREFVPNLSAENTHPHANSDLREV